MFREIGLLALASVLMLSTPVTAGVALPETVVYVDPEESLVKVCQTFTVNVSIAEVSGLQGFDFCLSYDTTVLDCLEVEEGPFMAGCGPTFVVKQEIDDQYQKTRGRVWLVVVIYGDGFANGSGTLGTITFNATALGESALDLHSIQPYRSDQVKLATCGPEPIPNVAVDGYVKVSCNPDPPNPPSPDLNGDGIVDIMDVVAIARVYGASQGDPNFDEYADLNQNGTVDMGDLVIVAVNYGKIF